MIKIINSKRNAFKISNLKFGYYLGFRILILGFLLLPSAASAALIIQAPKYIGLNSGLVGYWSFDGKDMAGVTAYDRSGNANNGTLTNGPVRAIGKIGQGLSFDGVNDVIDAGTNITPKVNGISGSAWVNMLGVADIANDDRVVMALWTAGFTGNFNFVVGNYTPANDDHLLFVANPDDTWPAVQSTGTINLNGWQHIAFTYDGANVRFYFNGTLDSSPAFSTSLLTTAGQRFVLGNVNLTSTDNNFQGYLDDVRIYNRAINTDEIKRLYRIGATLKINTDVSRDNPDLNSGLVGYWSFDGKDMAGVTAYDRSGNANNGTLTNGPVRAIGKIGQGLSFDGVNDVIDAGTNITPKVNGISGSAWVNMLGVADIANDDRVVMALWTAGFTGNFNFVVGNYTPANDDHLLFVANPDDTWPAVQSTGTINLNGWQHIAFTYDGANVRFYFNGTLDSSPAFSTSLLTTAGQRFVLGNVNLTSTDDNFQGYLDDVRVYNRALSGDEIKRLYRIGATLKINTSINNDSLANGLVGYWSMNAPDVAGTTAYDRSGQGKNGTFTGVDGSTDTIAVDGTPSTATFTTGNPINVSHTTGSGANFMLVGISITNDNFGSISSVTYNGDALTEVCRNDSDEIGRAHVYYRVNPDITTANVTVTLSTGAASGGVIGVMTFSGGNTTTPLGA